MNIKALIEDIIVGLANNEPLSSLISKIQVVSKLIRNKEFITWVENEFINGYNADSDLPEYRKVNVINVKASFVEYLPFGAAREYKSFDLPIMNLGIEKYTEIMIVNIKDTSCALEKILEQQKSNIPLAVNDYEKLIIQRDLLSECAIGSIYKNISRIALDNIISKAKTKLLDTFIELNESIFDKKINFNLMERKEDIAKIVHQTINTGIYNAENATTNIDSSNIVGGNKNTVKYSNNFKEQISDLVAQIEKLSEEIESDREDIAFEISKIKMALEQEQTPKLIKSAFNAIKGIASGIVENVAANKITDLINKTLPNITF